jgi:hypothetical protein
VCDTKVTVIQGAAPRQKVSATTTLYRAFAWCRLLPCGHTFKVRAGGLIHEPRQPSRRRRIRLSGA